jgi:hypothetical protein
MKANIITPHTRLPLAASLQDEGSITDSSGVPLAMIAGKAINAGERFIIPIEFHSTEEARKHIRVLLDRHTHGLLSFVLPVEIAGKVFGFQSANKSNNPNLCILAPVFVDKTNY